MVLDANGVDPSQRYSTNLSMSLREELVLSPKGGRPSRTGKSVFYQGGYRQYKEESRRRGGPGGDSAEVDLVSQVT